MSLRFLVLFCLLALTLSVVDALKKSRRHRATTTAAPTVVKRFIGRNEPQEERPPVSAPYKPNGNARTTENGRIPKGRRGMLGNTLAGLRKRSPVFITKRSPQAAPIHPYANVDGIVQQQSPIPVASWTYRQDQPSGFSLPFFNILG